MTIYDGYGAWQPGEWPTMLAIGDSWFWYPHNNLLEALARHAKLKDPYRHMVCLGRNGAYLSDYVDVPGRPGPQAARLKELLRPDPLQYITAFLVSGAGNDSVEYGLGLRDDCSTASAPEDCIAEEGMRELVGNVTKSMSLLLHEVLWAFDAQRRAPLVLLHGYDYAVPDGRPFRLAMLSQGPWLSVAMDRRQVPPDLELRKGIVRILIDRINAAFANYARPGSGIHFIDSTNALDSGAAYQDDWANELHPTRDGFDRIVDTKWIPVLQQLGIAKGVS
ncbi:MAG TPA: hypothetical protein VFX67_05565 [Burkholderiales bacterium]|nr:hypothetical protein [Burkholderiales bacterium]